MGRRLCYTAAKGHTHTMFYTDLQLLLSACACGLCSVACYTHPFNKYCWMSTVCQALSWVLRDSREQTHKPKSVNYIR